MLPLISDNAELEVECCNISELRKGDMVVFYDKELPVAHRCLLVFRGVFYERGDNCGLWVRCPSRSENDLIGRIVAVHLSGEKTVDPSLPAYHAYKGLLVCIGLLSALAGLALRRNPEFIQDRELSSCGLVGRLIYKVIKNACKRVVPALLNGLRHE